MIYILLKNVNYYAFHGLYDVEKETGNSFVVNLKVGFEPESSPITRLNESIDYCELKSIVDGIMLNAQYDLLETIVQQIQSTITGRYTFLKEVFVSIEKQNPPIPEFNGSTAVELLWHSDL